MRQSFRLTVAAFALAAIAAPLGAQATHCTPGIIIFSGVDSGQNDHTGAPIRPGPNGSLAGCAVEPNEEALGVIVPGATNMVVAYTSGTTTSNVEGTITFNGTTTDLTFSWIKPLYATAPRWESQSIPTTAGTGPVTATIVVDGEEFGSVTYQKYA